MRSVSSTLPAELVCVILESMETIELFRFKLDSDGPYCTMYVSESYVIKGTIHSTIIVILLTKFVLSPVGIAGLEGPVILVNIRNHSCRWNEYDYTSQVLQNRILFFFLLKTKWPWF